MAKIQRQVNPFTLVELLAVIGIIAVVLVLSAPVFRRIAGGSAVDTGARMLSSQLMLARAEAISRRRCVAVIIPGEHFNSDDRNNYHFSAFRSAFVEADAGNGYKFVEWVPGTAWRFLPNGALTAILETSGSGKPCGLETVNGETIPKQDTSYNIPKDSSGGGLGQGCESGCTYVKDDSSNDHYMVDSSHTNSSNGVRAIVYRANGRAAQTGFLTIMEGVVEVGDSTPNSSRLNRANIRVMEISQYSGQVKFRY